MVDYNRIIYKKDTKGKLRYLHIYTGERDGEYLLVQTSGIVDGKAVRNERVCKPKNVGRANETTAQEQAWKQAEAKLVEKLKKDYFETEEEAMTAVVILPMLAETYGKKKDKIDWEECYIQPKFDGQRCLAILTPGLEPKLISRQGNEIITMPHIVEELVKITSEIKAPVVLDGELYAHGLNFQENMRLIKKNRGEESQAVSYHIYDVMLDTPFWSRNRYINHLDLSRCSHLLEVDTFRCLGEENVRNSHEKFVSLGYEGSMVRHGKDGYKVSGRSAQLLKNKNFIDIAIPIKDIRPTDGRSSHGQPWFDWKGAKNDEMSAGTKGTHEYREKLLANKEDYIGLIAEVRFFEYYDTGVPRFPVMVGIRNDK